MNIKFQAKKLNIVKQRYSLEFWGEVPKSAELPTNAFWVEVHYIDEPEFNRQFTRSVQRAQAPPKQKLSFTILINLAKTLDEKTTEKCHN